MQAILLPVLMTLLMSAASRSAIAQQMRPGLWETKAEMTLNGIELPTMTDSDCVSEKSAKDARRYVTRYLEANECQVTLWTYHPPALSVGVRCDNNFGKGAGTLKGTLSPNHFKMKGIIKTSTEVEFGLDFSGRYTQNCKK
ncbi:MAG: DUF3617 family protein [Bdellovibrionaceae bacterium]|nr:DUF3617 family protein [Pseudobdellovibrionaceae bacterium]